MKAALEFTGHRTNGSSKVEDVSECRICAGKSIRKLGTVEYYLGFAWPVFDCSDCGARFTVHEKAIYDAMHRNAGTVYNVYRELHQQAKESFHRGDLTALRQNLFQTQKYRFIIEEIDKQSRDARLLEVGCSRGYLTSYFILAGYRVIGADVSPEAIESARAAFGPHFVLEDDGSIEAGAPYDVIYHVGTIGCVADPLGFTRRLLNLLKPGGCLLFNSPNRDGCWLSDQLWLDAAPPPDLVSLFPPGFWVEHFSSEAAVEELVQTCSDETGLRIGLRKLFGRHWDIPKPVSLDNSSEHYQSGRVMNDGFWSVMEKSAVRFATSTRLSRLAPRQPSEFGLYVKMIRA